MKVVATLKTDGIECGVIIERVVPDALMVIEDLRLFDSHF